jgi:hypothetical protein
MIGLSANAIDLQIAEEFFELFKTHWEWAIPGRKYRVVLSTHGDIENLDAEVFLIYGSGAVATDHQTAMPVEQVSGPAEIGWGCSTLPIYGQLALFEAGTDAGVLTSAGKTVDYRHRSGSRVVWRIGYDLFGEVRHLLTEGQPVSHATTPTLELHIALLRHVLLESGIPFVEIPPRPHGYDFICCLTHDVDFFGIRRHKFDRTLAGFVVRALVGSLTDLVRGRRPPADAAQNWLAVLSLPFVFLGLVPDFWRPFDDYAEVENGRRSTFFLVPFKGRPGASPDGSVDATRAVPYQVSEIRAELRTAAGRGAELAVHGINAWRDAAAGVAEMRELTSLTGQRTAGVRMHWLYFGADSPRQLETAGFAYDSTCGYNDAVGYRAGTSQAFRLPGTENLMELPLSIMDSALFYPRQMGLAHQDEREAIRRHRGHQLARPEPGAGTPLGPQLPGAAGRKRQRRSGVVCHGQRSGGVVPMAALDSLYRRPGFECCDDCRAGSANDDPGGADPDASAGRVPRRPLRGASSRWT